MSWPEIQACVDNNKHELRVTGKTLEKRLEETNGAVPEQLCATGPLLTFAELSGCPQLISLPANIGLMTNLHGEYAARGGGTEAAAQSFSTHLCSSTIVFIYLHIIKQCLA